MLTEEQKQQEAISLRARYLYLNLMEKEGINYLANEEHYDTTLEIEDFIEDATNDVNWFLRVEGNGWKMGLIDTEAELPENPHKVYDRERAWAVQDEREEDRIETGKYGGFDEGQQSLISQGWRKTI